MSVEELYEARMRLLRATGGWSAERIAELAAKLETENTEAADAARPPLVCPTCNGEEVVTRHAGEYVACPRCCP